MPLPSVEDYERLGEHLTAVDVPLAAFASARGYTVQHRGRYPNRRLTRFGSVVRSIHITMDVDESGQRFDHFYPDIPYIIWGGAWIDDDVAHIRISSPHIETWQVPFSALVRTLPMHLDHFHSYLSALTEDYIRASGTRSPLSDVPPENA
jgi:hypothetical protein